MGNAVKGLGAGGGEVEGCKGELGLWLVVKGVPEDGGRWVEAKVTGGPRGLGRAVSVKKPPVFIGLGAVYNRNLNTLLGTENPLAFLRIG